MVFSIIVIVLIGLVAYFHYLQGFFSAGLSAVLALVAAMIAFGYYETLVLTVFKGAMGDNSVAVALVGLFAVTYLILRVAFDQLIPGNLRFPVIVDKVGAGALGLVAGVVASGLLVVAAQSMPFGHSIGGYSRYPVVEDISVNIQMPQQARIQEALFNELDHDKFQNDEPNKLWVPVDDLLLGVVASASGDGGSLSAGKPFTSVHPNYLQELFGQRVGVQVASRHVAWNAGDKNNVEVHGVFYTSAPLPQDDPERWEVGEKEKTAIGVRHASRSAPLNSTEFKALEKSKTYRPGPNKVALVLRVGFNKEIGDEKTVNISFSPSGVRLVAGGENYYPIGVLAAGALLQRQAPDDHLFVAPDKKVDLVFEVDESKVFGGGEAGGPRKIASGAFFEFKRLARTDLSGKDAITPVTPPALEEVEVVRKEGAPLPGAMVAAGGKSAPFTIEGTPKINDKLPQRINVATNRPNENNGTQTWGQFTMKDRRFTKLEIDPTDPIGRMATGDDEVMAQMLAIPDGQRLVQVTGRPSRENPWAWADAVPELTLVDTAGKRHVPSGFCAKVVGSDGREFLFARYDVDRKAGTQSAPSDARPTEIVLYYLIPRSTELKTFDFKGTPLANVNFNTQ